MQLLEAVKKKITYLHTCRGAYILAHAAWSACDHRYLPGPSALEISANLDLGNIELVHMLQQITGMADYSNPDQAEMLRWIHEQPFGYSNYIAKQLKTTKKKLIDWE